MPQSHPVLSEVMGSGARSSSHTFFVFRTYLTVYVRDRVLFPLFHFFSLIVECGQCAVVARFVLKEITFWFGLNVSLGAAIALHAGGVIKLFQVKRIIFHVNRCFVNGFDGGSKLKCVQC